MAEDPSSDEERMPTVHRITTPIVKKKARRRSIEEIEA
jgi:hypothetical protein